MDSRLPKLVFLLLAAYAAIQFSAYYARLPETVASHFDAHGAPNGWQTKTAFFSVLIAVSVLAVLFGFGVPRIIKVMPAELINLPNKGYWLAPEHIAETQQFLETSFAWFGCAVFLLLILTFDYAMQFNLHPHSPPDASRMWYILAGFLVFVIAWTIRMLAKFLRPPDAN